jgi:mitochondrial fission protein ELM1
MNNDLVKPDYPIHSNQPLVWITKTLTDGDTNTRIGIAEHIGGFIRELEVPNEFRTQEQIKDRLKSANLITTKKMQWPNVIIGPSLHIPYMQEIKSMSGGKTIVVALRTPVRDLPIEASKDEINRTDVIVSYPYHNNDHLPNLLICESLPNRVTLERISTERLKWESDFSPFFERGPVIGMLVGGDVGDKRRVFSEDIAADLGTMVNQIAEKLDASILISLSSRTTAECKKIICSKITVPNYVYDPKTSLGCNPYFAILGSVDYVIVTADSISMCYEAVSSGKPVYLYYDENFVESTHTKIVDNLVARGCARILNRIDNIEMFSYPPINSAKNVARKVHEILTGRESVDP